MPSSKFNNNPNPGSDQYVTEHVGYDLQIFTHFLASHVFRLLYNLIDPVPNGIPTLLPVDQTVENPDYGVHLSHFAECQLRGKPEVFLYDGI
jgi:hypothetical protein